MTAETYNKQFEEILNATHTQAPYDNPDYLNYTKLNESRSRRWHKKGEISEETKSFIRSLKQKQKWIVITEHWCGDASHNVPFIELMAALNPCIELEIQLRDSGSEIDQYLTNGGKSIPKLIVRNEANKDIFVWGPRPAACQVIFLKMKEEGLDFEAQKIALQNWYNEDKGVSVQQEIIAGLAASM